MTYAKDDLSDEAIDALIKEVRDIIRTIDDTTVSSVYEDCLDLPYPMSIWHNHLLIKLTRYLGNDTWQAFTEDAECIIVNDLTPFDVVVALSVLERESAEERGWRVNPLPVAMPDAFLPM